MLDTGFARDVSGVLRVVRWARDMEKEDRRAATEGQGKEWESELLFYVRGDGGVDVFERGSDKG